MAPHHAYLHLLGTETLELRTERHCANALKLAVKLTEHPAVAAVNYPGLQSDPHHERARRYFGGQYGGLLTLNLGSREKCFSFLNRLKVTKVAANLGDSRTLAIHPASTIYGTCTDEEQRNAGISEDLIRVSVGIEGINDILSDFAGALL